MSRSLHLAADAHVPVASLVVLRAVREAREALDLAALEAALRLGAAGNAHAEADAAVDAFEAALLERPRTKEAVGDLPGRGLPTVAGRTMAAGARATEVCAVTKPWAGAIKQDKKLPAEAIASLRDELKQLPQKLRDVIEPHVTVQALGKKMAGSGGVYMPSDRLIAITVGAENPRVKWTLRHEAFHAFDWLHAGRAESMVGWRERLLSSSQTFKAAFDADVAAFTAAHRADGFTRYFAADPMEAFAEAGAHLTLTDGISPARRAAFSSAFKKTLVAMREILQQKGVL